MLEWTHGNSGRFSGVDIPILLSSTPAETRAYRLAWGRDSNADTAFITMVIELEQAKLEARAGAAKLIVSNGCEVLSYDEYCQQMDLNIKAPQVKEFYRETLDKLARAACPAFHPDANISVSAEESRMFFFWEYRRNTAKLSVDFSEYTFSVDIGTAQ